jgi:hypothetical protein
MEESISGFKERGSWGDVVEHGERITSALREAGAAAEAADAFEEWDEWRPKAHERIDEEVSEKTADQASVKEGEGEKEGRSPAEDIQSSGEKLSDSYAALDDADTGNAVEQWRESVEHAARAADTAGRKALRKVEDAVYRKVMTRFTPYYFDNELVSANLQWVRSQGEFEFEVNVNDDDRKDEVRDYLQRFDDIDRWHVDTEKDTETAVAAEGVEPPEEKTEAKSTTN